MGTAGPVWRANVAAATTTNIGSTFAVPAGGIQTLGAITGGSAYTNGTYYNVDLTTTSGIGANAQATIVVSGGAVTSVTVTYPGGGYQPADVVSASAADIGGTGTGFSVPVATASISGPGDTITGANGSALTIDGYTVNLNDRVLVKNQSSALEEGIYQLTQSPVAGIISTTGTVTQPTGGTMKTGLYQGVPLTGGSGSGAMATVSVALSGVATFDAPTAGTGYTNGTYNNVPLVGGHGTGASANITVAGNVVTTVTLVNPGSGYQASDSLTAMSNTYLGGTGSGFAVEVATVTSSTTPIVSGVYVTNPGINYVASDVLTYSANGQGFGNGGTITIGSVTAAFSGSGAQAGLITSITAVTQPSSKFVTNGSYYVSLTGGTGSGAAANVTIANGTASVAIVNPGSGYAANDSLGFTGTGLGTGGSVLVSTITFTPFVLTRTADANCSFQLEAMTTFVNGGSTQAGEVWVQETLAVTVDKTNLAFVRLGSL